MVKKIISLGLNLAIISAVAGFGLSFTYAVTRERIAAQIWAEQIKAAKVVLPEVKKDQDFKERKDLYSKVKKKFPEVDKIFEGWKDGKMVGYAFQMLPRGYGGPVTMMVGITPEGKTTGISIVPGHKETPGLGANIENPVWQKQFKQKTIKNRLEVNKDIDAISGATISSKAITKGVKEALQAYALFGGEAR